MADLTELDVVLGWSGPVLPIGRWAGDLDRRRFQNVSWPSLPLTLADNHQGTEFVGPIDSMEVLTVDEIAERVELSDQEREEIGERALWASGRFMPTVEGFKSAGQLAFWGRLPVSVEVRDGEFIETPVERDGVVVGREMDWARTVVGAVALERLPAFAGAWIRPDAEAAAFMPDPMVEDDDEEPMMDDEAAGVLVELRAEVDSYRQAGAGPHVFPARMFTKFDYVGPSRLSISPDGEVTGHAILWGKTHRANSNWTAAPNPRDDLSEWLVGATHLDDGRIIKTGVLVSDGLHGPAHQRGASADSVRRMIESTACQTAALNAWPDQWGIAVHGSTLPGVTVEQATRAMAGCPSVDQRDLGDGRGFVTMGVLCVSTCGFSPASSVVTMEDGEPVRRLVASATPEAGCGCGGTCGGCGHEEPLVPKTLLERSQARLAAHARAASADPEPDPKPPVVDLGALRVQDEAWERARLAAAVAKKPRPKS